MDITNTDLKAAFANNYYSTIISHNHDQSTLRNSCGSYS